MIKDGRRDSADSSAADNEPGDMLSRRSAIAGALCVVASATLLGGDIASAVASEEPAHLWGAFQTPGLEFAFQARVSIVLPPISFGECSYGKRRIIKISGGEFHGPKISGRVLNEGEDTQLVRPDGVTEICARYALRADDGTQIYIVNRGLIVPGPAPLGKPSYVRTHPTFEAPLGSSYEWLNRSLFIGTLNPMRPEDHAVIIRVFRVT